MSDPARSTEALLKQHTRQAILDATDRLSSSFNTGSIQPGSKRRRFTESSPTNPDELNVIETTLNNGALGSTGETAKRFCPNSEQNQSEDAHKWQPSSIKHWLALDLITAGRQGSDLGRDQAPIVQFAIALGHFPSKTVIDRLLINVQTESYIRQSDGSLDSSETRPESQRSITSRSNNSGTCDSSDQINNQHNSKSVANGDARLEGFVPLTTEATEYLARNSQSNIPSTNASNFEAALDMTENWLKSHGACIGDESLADCSLVLITDGHKALRNVLHPEAAYRGIDRDRLRRTPWSVYVDLIDWCKQAQLSSPGAKTKPMSTLSEVMEAMQLNLDACSGTGTALTKLDQMVAIIQNLVESGVQLSEPQIVRNIYEHRVFSRDISIKDGQVVEVRQVPWSATPSIIAGFFAGLNLLPGGVAIRLTDGRRSNTAIVAFECVLHAQLALVRHQHQLCGALLPESLNDTNVAQSEKSGTKEQSLSSSTSPNAKPVMLQVYSATSREFIQCAGCEQQSVMDFLSLLTNGEQVVVRVRGLPYTVSKQQILDFFIAVHAPVLFDCQGIYLVAYPDRRPTGDAFVLFADDKTATVALTRHKDYLGDRYVELFKASPSEMVQVCHNVSQQTHNSNKPHSSVFDLQTRARSTINALGLPTVLPTLTSYLTPEQQIALALKSLGPACHIPPLSSIHMTTPGLLPAGIFPISDLHSSLSESPNPDSTLDPLTMIHNTLGLNPSSMIPFAFNMPRPASTLANIATATPTLTALRVKSTTDPVIKDLTDPTDPECPFARPLPEHGVSAMLQLSSLPLETSRHDVRLYLGPANLAKVYRMRRMEMADSHASTSTWLLSLIDTNEAIHLIRDLVNRTFSLGTMTGLATQIKVFPNVPTFALYHVGSDKQLKLVPLDSPSLGIPFNRIHDVSGTIVQQQKHHEQQQQQRQQPMTYPAQMNSPMPNANLLTQRDATFPTAMNKFSNPSQLFPQGASAVPTESMYNQLLQAIVSQSQFTNSKSTGFHPNQSALASVSIAGSINPVTNPSGSFNPLLPVPPGSLGTLGDQLTSSLVNNPMASVGSTPVSSGSNSNACLVMITGAPMDATAEELGSLFQPVVHLLSAPPRFTLYQSQTNGTANFLAIFATPLDAQTAAIYCPSGSLRNNQYAIGVACLVPPGSTLDPVVNVQYNASAQNLMFCPLPMMTNTNSLM